MDSICFTDIVCEFDKEAEECFHFFVACFARC